MDFHRYQHANLPYPKWWVMRDGTPIGICHMRTGHIISTVNMLRAQTKPAGMAWRNWMVERMLMELNVRSVDYEHNKDNPEGPYK